MDIQMAAYVCYAVYSPSSDFGVCVCMCVCVCGCVCVCLLVCLFDLVVLAVAVTLRDWDAYTLCR